MPTSLTSDSAEVVAPKTVKKPALTGQPAPRLQPAQRSQDGVQPISVSNTMARPEKKQTIFHGLTYTTIYVKVVWRRGRTRIGTAGWPTWIFILTQPLQKSDVKDKTCFNCGRKGHLAKKCGHCGKKGHVAKDWRRRPKRNRRWGRVRWNWRSSLRWNTLKNTTSIPFFCSMLTGTQSTDMKHLCWSSSTSNHWYIRIASFIGLCVERSSRKRVALRSTKETTVYAGIWKNDWRHEENDGRNRWENKFWCTPDNSMTEPKTHPIETENHPHRHPITERQRTIGVSNHLSKVI